MKPRRKDDRLAVDPDVLPVKVEILGPDGQPLRDVRLENISRAGMFVTGAPGLGAGDLFRFALDLGPAFDPVQGEGKVQWVRSTGGSILHPEGVGATLHFTDAASAKGMARLVQVAQWMARLGGGLWQKWQDESQRVFHNLKSPIGTMQSLNAMLTEGEVTPQQFVDLGYDKMVADTCARALALIDDVLTFDRARLDATRALSGSLDDPYPLGDYLRDLLRPYQVTGERGGVAVQGVLGAGESVLVRVPKLAVFQIVDNLLSNALRQTPQGGRVLASLEGIAGFVRIVVEDTGVGIPEEKLQTLFQRRNVVPADRTSLSGTGLGLYFTREIVRSLGGEINVQSALGRGTKFVVVLPSHM